MRISIWPKASSAQCDIGTGRDHPSIIGQIRPLCEVGVERPADVIAIWVIWVIWRFRNLQQHQGLRGYGIRTRQP